jgi:hypothetical protein
LLLQNRQAILVKQKRVGGPLQGNTFAFGVEESRVDLATKLLVVAVDESVTV